MRQATPMDYRLAPRPVSSHHDAGCLGSENSRNLSHLEHILCHRRAQHTILLQIRPSLAQARPWTFTLKVCSAHLNLALDHTDSTTIGPTNGSYSLTPLPKRKEGNQGTSKSPTPSDGGDVVGECSVHGSQDYSSPDNAL